MKSSSRRPASWKSRLHLTRIKIRLLWDWKPIEFNLLILAVVLWLVLTGIYLYRWLSECACFDLIKRLFKTKVDQKLADSLRAEFAHNLPKSNFKPFKALPKEGLKANQVNKRLQEMADFEMDIKSQGKYSGAVFSTDEDLMQLSKEASNRFLFSNLLFYELSQYSRQLEKEVVSMLLNLFKGNSNCTGFTTSGGSESLQLAVLAHKRHYLTRKGITEPEIVMPETAHPALFKACEYYKVKPVVIPVGPGNQVTVDDYRTRITENTILLICSAPNFMFGTFDPCKALGALALERNVGCLLDIGIGSFLVPFAKENGIKLPEENYDFSVKGITAISIEPSKYGLAPVGMGCLLFSEDQLQKDLYWTKTDWCGYVYCSVNYTGSRSAGPIAVVWAMLVYHGYNTYAKLAAEVFNNTKALVEKLNKVKGIQVNGNPIVAPKLSSVVVYHSLQQRVTSTSTTWATTWLRTAGRWSRRSSCLHSTSHSTRTTPRTCRPS